MPCTSTPGIGSTFTLLLPCVDVGRSVAPPVAPPVDVQPTHCVLLADDDPGPRDTLRRLLAHEGFGVEVSESGAKALALLETLGDRISILVTDYVMPQMSGRELLEQARLRHPHLPAIVISGYAPDRGTAALLTQLNAGFLAKPFTGAKLAQLIRHQLVNRTAAAAAPHSRCCRVVLRCAT